MKIFLASPWYFEQCTFNYFMAVMNELKPLHAAGHTVYYQATIGDVVHKQRNSLCARFLASDADWLWMVDIDQGFRGEDCLRRLAAGLPVMSVNIPRRTYNFDSSINGDFKSSRELSDALLTGTVLTPEQPRTERGMVAAFYVGTGDILIRRDVLLEIIRHDLVEKLSAPSDMPAAAAKWFHRFFFFNITEPGHPIGAGIDLGEDYNFCDLVRQAGFTVWVDPQAETSHAGLYTFSGKPKLRTLPASAGQPQPINPVLQEA